MRQSRLGVRDFSAAWFDRQNDRLDARLASAFLQTIWGSEASARREFEACRQEMSSHLKGGERRVFAAIATLDERTQALERFEWKTHTRDLHQAFAAVARELRLATGGRYTAFAALRRALHRHRRHQHHLLKLAASVEVATPHAVEAFL
jgi:hypothetical protein